MNEIFKLRLKTRWRKRISTVCYAVGIGVFCWLTIAIHNDNFKFSLGQSVRSFTFNSGDYIHLITATDEEFFAGLPTLINSVQMTSRNSQSVMFHVIVCGDDDIVERLREYLACFGIGTTTDIKVQIVKFNPAAVVDEDIMFAWEFMFTAKRLKSDCNYARSYMYSLFPDVKRAIYLDVDTVVKEPIENLWRIGQNYQSPLLASEVNRTYEQDGFVLETVSDLYQKRYGKRFDPSRTVFNGGVLVIDLDFYRKYNLISEVEYWAQAYTDAPTRLWRFDCQSIFQIVYHELWAKLNDKWNSRGLGKRRPRPPEQIETAGILHWSATHKPWSGVGPHVDLWEHYRPAECSNRGVCHHNPNATRYGYWKCHCEAQYSGIRCQKSL